MVLDIGEKIHVIERRQFDSDVRRHFFGVVERAEATVVRARGYVFVYDSSSSSYVRSEEQRTRVIPLSSSGLIINVAPKETNVEDVRYVADSGQLSVTDGGVFRLAINEFGRSR